MVGAQPRVLVVDDEHAVRDSLQKWLQMDGFAVEVAGGAQAALGWLEREAFDVALVDLHLPGMDGVELQRLIQQRAPHLAVIVTTGHASVRTAVDVLKRGAFDYLTKPVARDELSRVIHRTLQQQRALLEGAQKYQALFEQLIDGIFLHDLEGNILDVNRAAVTQSGFSKDELLRMTVFDLITDDVPREAIVAQWRQWHPSHPVIVESRHRCRDGTTLPVEINTGRVHYGTGDLMLAIVRDVSERKQAERDRELLEEQLRHAQKMDAVGRLAGGVAHDFNNMLCGILGNTELALAELPAAAPLRASLEAVVDAAERAASLTRQLLAFSRKQVTAPQVLDLGQLVDSLHPMLSRLLGEDIVLRTVASHRPGRVRVDPGQIEQVVLNLAINARDAMPGGGDLLIETSDVTLDEGYCAQHADTAPGDCVMLAVSDTGSGMDAATRAKIFEPFFTTKERGKGTGLGLATVFGIVQQSGGRIEVYSEPGRGTSFKIYLPRVLAALEPGARARPSAPARGEETVLVVEDEQVVRDVAVKYLERCGYAVLVAASGAEALQLAERHAGRIDLLFSDVIMPGMNGHELASKLAAARPGLRVLFTSGYTESVVGRHGVLDEGVQFVAKPYSRDALTTRVREVLDGPCPETG